MVLPSEQVTSRRDRPPLREPRQWGSFLVAVLIVIAAQSLLAAVIAISGAPALGALAAGTLALCGVVLLAAAASQARRPPPFDGRRR